MKKYIVIIIIIIVGAGFTFGLYKYFSSKKKTTPTTTQASTNKSNTKTSTDFDKSKYSLTDPTSIWVVVNKHNALPINYAPKLTIPDVKLRLNSSEQQMQISTDTAPAFKEMFQAAVKDDINLVFGSGYRSGELQKQFYNDYVAKDGVAAADTYSARPGHSEHQTGLSADITSQNGDCHLEICFSETPEGKWLANNAYKFGFIIRYPKDKQNVTGYQYEPWHVRYVGKDLSAEIHKTNQTLEEFFKLPPAPDYD